MCIHVSLVPLLWKTLANKLEYYSRCLTSLPLLPGLTSLPKHTLCVCVYVQSPSCVWLFASPLTAACQASLSFTISGVYSNSCPLSRWCYLTISSSAASFSFCPQSFPASGSFPTSRLFALGGHSIRTSASASVLPMNIQVLFPLGLAGWISLQSKGLLRVLSINSLILSLLYGPALTSIHDYWKNHTFD